ncbi:CDIF630_02480 family spore surface protein [Aminipila sp.]|uniref:CDIF630_02480 family spore surface protein n=1 Tax=Aminipila sp. TaxID=2060095 RepID=UPI002896992E|nr:DUF3787 domain-containing protein [Aminipila sp.]
MKDSTKNTLNGADNMRLNPVDSTNNEGTAAWTNTEQTASITNLNIPSEYNIGKAKNWVDNGSQL